MLLALSPLLWTGCGSGVHAVEGGSASQPVAVSAGPQLGYVWRADDQTLRPILGVPGSAQIGAGVTSAGLYIAGMATPNGQTALLAGSDGSIYRKALPDGAATALNVSIGTDALIRISPSGKQAVVYSPSSGQAATISDVSAAAPQKVALPQNALDVTISDAGSIALAIPAGGAVQANVIDGAGQSHRSASVGAFGGFVFLSGVDDLLIADASTNTLTRVHGAASSPSSETLQTAGLLHTPVAVGGSSNGQWALVANKDNGSVVRVGITASGAQSFLCDCNPTAVQPVLGGSTFRVTDRTDLPLWVMDVSAAQPHLTFVPGLGTSTATPVGKQTASVVQP